MATIGLIGAGHIGSTLARLAIAGGHDVILSNSRGPDTLQPLTIALGDHARAATPEEAAEQGDIVIVTVPLKNYRQVPSEPLRGKVVIDTNNYYPERDGHFPELDDESTTTSELLQAHLPNARVVKAFNNINYLHLGRLARPVGDPERSVLAIAGDDETAKESAAAFLDSIGYDTLDAGPLAEGWRFQRDLPAYVLPYIGDDGDAPTLGGNENPGLGRPVSREQLAAALADGKRYSDL